MDLLESKRFKLPTLYFITDRETISDIPPGVPFIYGEPEDRDYIIRLLEYEVLYKKAKSTGLPFDFKALLEDAGFKDLLNLSYENPPYIDITSDDFDPETDRLYLDDKHKISKNNELFKQYVRDAAAYVDIEKLKDLKVFPVWLDKIEKAVETNVHNFAAYNPNMYNKKLEGMYGSIDLVSPDRNLIVIDISGSIPKAVSSTCLILSKNLAETFYADLLITGSKSTLYHYENLHELNVQTIYDENGTDNDQLYFRKLVEEDKKYYKTAIVFGDNHHPGQTWSNDFNSDTKNISDGNGKKICSWEVDKLISFHTGGIANIAGYARWFEPKEVEKIKDWVKYLN